MQRVEILSDRADLLILKTQIRFYVFFLFDTNMICVNRADRQDLSLRIDTHIWYCNFVSSLNTVHPPKCAL